MRRLACLLLAAGVLAACGGGGGSDGGAAGAGGGGAGGSGGSPPAPPGSFSLSPNALTFSAKNYSSKIAGQQFLIVTLADSAPAAVGAAYKPGVAPASWLTVTALDTVVGRNNTFAFFPNTTRLPPGTYTTTVTIGTADASGNILQARDVEVTYVVRDGLAITTLPPGMAVLAGSPVLATFEINVSAPAGAQWAASASQPWLVPPAGTQTGSGPYTIAIDASALPPGQFAARLTLTNVADPTDTAVMDLTMNTFAPALSTNVPSFQLGGESGLDRAPAELRFSLGTLTRAHPWTLVASTTSGGNWLTVSKASGTVSASESTVTVSAERGQLASGVYTGELVLRADVNGAPLTKTLPVTFRVEANRLVVNATGVAFSKFPSKAVLTRTLAVRNTAGEPAVGWQATSSAAWLAATLSGTTGQPLVLTADPTGLAAGQYFADVTVVSTDPRVGNTEGVRVGLTVRTTDPLAQVDAAGVVALATAANPVEPELFAIVGTGVQAYDVYSGALLRPLSATTGMPIALAMSGDGRSLFVAENEPSGARIVERDPAGGAVRRTFSLSQPQLTFITMAHARPDSHPVLLTSVDSFDMATTARFAAAVAGAGVIAVSSDQRYAYTQDLGLSPATISRYGLHYSTLAPASLLIERLTRNNGLGSVVRSNGQDLAVGADGAVVYGASGYPYWFDRLAADTLSVLAPPLGGVPYPNNVETCWNGRIGAGANASSDPAGDLWVYDSSGAERARLDSGADLITQSIRFSGDCTRLVSATYSGLRFQAVP